jgi:predicted peptidase
MAAVAILGALGVDVRPSTSIRMGMGKEHTKSPTRRRFMALGSAAGAVLAGTAAGSTLGVQEPHAPDDENGFQAATTVTSRGPRSSGKKVPGIQTIHALCEVTCGGQKVYGIAVEYDAAIDTVRPARDTFATSVFPAARRYSSRRTQNSTSATPATPEARPAVAVYTNAEPALLGGRRSVAGTYVIAEFEHDPDLSIPSTDCDKVSLTQDKDVRTVDGTVYAASPTVWDNVGERRDNVVIRGVDDWEQDHWWWDDKRSAWLEYSIYLPKSFLKEGAADKEYPLVMAITHSGTSYGGTCAETLTEQNIASIWGMPEEQAKHECVVITPRYERTTMNDCWEHTSDVENTYKLVESMIENRWNFGNPNKKDRRDKVLKIDRKRVYCTGWSMGAMTSLWMMAKHPDTLAAGLIIAGQQRPGDLVDLANVDHMQSLRAFFHIEAARDWLFRQVKA